MAETMIALFLRAEAGATAVEYSLVLGLIALGIIAAASNVGTELQEPFQAIEVGFQNSR